ncbi:FAD-binding oxidoreductase [Kitasatospora sp. SUK 42]|uniref:FAD-binding oxidoreductase n=1 Tax=Kitasatospora sp. SUK 42 TaxID=1588882 RepID=UPI001C31A990|nr:FAD-binding protein [Kitasatospora sp. SUK 42]MBV2155801.1 FAD-binding protein [Kitasatospora sp. SUK 42]
MSTGASGPDTAPAGGGSRADRLGRRGFLARAAGAGLAGAALTGATVLRETPAAASPAPTAEAAPRTPAEVPVVLEGRDPQYDSLRVGYNRRFDVHPDEILTPRDAEEAVAAVQRALDQGRRFTAYGGGHCFEDFVLSPDVRSLINMNSLDAVAFDAGRGVYSVGAGARLLNVYDSLYRRYGVTVPGGVCYSVGVGGHVLGGGYGLLSRLHGLTVDHLHGVEVVTVDAQRRASLTYCDRNSTGDLKDLFWAHTGGGGGNFGLVTRFDFRTPGAERSLVSPPAGVQIVTCDWPWEGVGPAQLGAFFSEFADWCARHHADDPAYDAVFPWLTVRHRDFGGIGMVMQVSAPDSAPLGDALVARLAATLGRDAGPSHVTRESMPWLNSVRLIGTSSAENSNPNRRGKQGSANFRGQFTEVQKAEMYRALTEPVEGSVSAGIDVAALGGAISRPAPGDTAVHQRDATMRLLVQTFWQDAAHDTPNIAWLRRAYHGIFRETGGVPVHNAVTAGSYVNYPNSDLSDPALNTSGVGAGELYYGQNYARLRAVKRRWDPTRVFHHAQSVEG